MLRYVKRESSFFSGNAHWQTCLRFSVFFHCLQLTHNLSNIRHDQLYVTLRITVSMFFSWHLQHYAPHFQWNFHKSLNVCPQSATLRTTISTYPKYLEHCSQQFQLFSTIDICYNAYNSSLQRFCTIYNIFTRNSREKLMVLRSISVYKTINHSVSNFWLGFWLDNTLFVCPCLSTSRNTVPNVQLLFIPWNIPHNVLTHWHSELFVKNIFLEHFGHL